MKANAKATKQVVNYLPALTEYITTFSTSDSTAKSINPAPIAAGKDVAAVVLAGKYTATGTITSGKILSDAILQLALGQGNDLPLDVKPGTLPYICQILNDGIGTGMFQDATPTTATEANFMAVIYGPFKTRFFTDPKIYFGIRDLSVLGTLTAFTATIDIGVIYADAPVARGKYISTEVHATAGTRHEYNTVGPNGGMLRRALLVGSTAGRLSNVEMTAVNGIKPVSCRSEKLLQACYCAWADVAAATAGAKYLIEGLNAPYYPGRQFIVECSTADTMTAVFENWV